MGIEGMMSTGFTVLIMIISILFVGALAAGGTMLYLWYRKYTQFDCVILNPANKSITKDTAGIFVDSKTKNKRFFMRKSNVGLDPDNVPYMFGQGGRRIVFLIQDGLKNFRYLNLKFSDNTPQILVGEEDVNWAINAYEKQKKLFSNTLLAQLLPILIIAIPSMVILIIFVYFFKNFDVLRDVAVQLKEAAVAIAQAKAGTLVVGG